MLDEQTGELHSQATNNSPRSQVRGVTDFGSEKRERVFYGLESSGASRFFYVAKASKAERNAGLEGFEEDAAGRTNAGRNGRRSGLNPRRNHHPTVKPVSLMRWLVRLVTPPGGLVLDPFTGSGTTGIAAALEGFRFTGCEQDAEYARIAEARIAWWAEHGEDALRIVAERERAEAERQEHVDAGQIGLFGIHALADSGDRDGEPSAGRRYTERGASNFAMKPGRRRK